jgi:hypothetical protein
MDDNNNMDFSDQKKLDINSQDFEIKNIYKKAKKTNNHLDYDHGSYEEFGQDRERGKR